MLDLHISSSPLDGGPIYKETIMTADQLIVEPWNAVSSIAIIIPAVFWAFKLYSYPVKNFWFMWYCIPLLILGGTGSTLFHAFRNSKWLLYLDVLPTAILTLSIGLLFWIRLTRNWYFSLSLFAISIFIRFHIYDWVEAHTAINITYFITGTLIFLPILLYLNKKNWLGLKWIVLSVAFLLLSLFFREVDKRDLFELTMGTHFLWHLLSGIGAYFLAKFLYILRLNELKSKLSDL